MSWVPGGDTLASLVFHVASCCQSVLDEWTQLYWVGEEQQHPVELLESLCRAGVNPDQVCTVLADPKLRNLIERHG